MVTISKSQLAALILMFQIGSTPLFLLGKSAGVDAWIAILIAMAAGLLLLLLLLQIHRLEPDKELIEIFFTYCGKFIGYGMAAAYFFYFSYKSIRNVREFAELIGLYMLPKTPLWVLVGCIILLASYAVWQGLEVIGRVIQILVPLILMVYAFFFAMIYGTGLINIHRIQPVLENGIFRVLEASLPELVSFPFGEMVLLLMFWKHVTPKADVVPVTIRWYLITGMITVCTNVIILACLGPLSQMSVAPFIEVVSLVRFKSFLERLDPFVSAVLFTGVFIKLTLYFLGASFVCKHLVKMRTSFIILKVGGVIFVGALMFRNYLQQNWIGQRLNLNYHFPLFQIILPLLLLAMMVIRHRLRNGGKRKASEIREGGG
ncbi:GerAB/ArcD/ProY family transporter [Paenibacillus xanthanilyticus]|uniref:Endospore germination permease n=1 Tax=Paenibacillus xanthanilyticus TaxID=1783531 RepID=A0ABV8K6H5_9BACL